MKRQRTLFPHAVSLCAAGKPARAAANKTFTARPAARRQSAAFFLYQNHSGGKTLWRAAGRPCRRRAADYAGGRFSFAGKYPAVYAGEFFCLYHYYRVADSGGKTPPEAPRPAASKAAEDLTPAAFGQARPLGPSLPRYSLKGGAEAAAAPIPCGDCGGASAPNVFIRLSAAAPRAARKPIKQKTGGGAPS